MYNRKLLSLLVMVLFLLEACDVTDQSPKQSLPTSTIFTSETNVRAVLAGAYSGLQGGTIPDYYVFTELAGDDAQHTGSYPSWASVDQHNLLASNAEARDMWINFYNTINRANNIIANTQDVDDSGFSDAEKGSVIAQGKIIRAISYQALARWFGGVPLVLAPVDGITEEANVSRASLSAVYDQVIQDLKDAQSALGATGSPGASRATGWTATALLSRVYLDSGDYQLAEDAATDVIDHGPFSLPDDYITNWGAGPNDQPVPNEIIFTLSYTTEDNNSLAFFARPNGNGGRFEYGPTQDMVNSYEANDERINANIRVFSGGLRLGKYFRVNGDDNVIIIRLGEVYLNRAEARARQTPSDVPGALLDVNVIRNRANLGPAAAATQDDALAVILTERRHELSQEGHRFFDLRRFGVAQSIEGISDPNNLLWPIPQRETQANPNLTQNPGY